MKGVSILIPCFNAASFISQTLESVLNATQEEDEIILVDDGSTDGSIDIAGRTLSASGVKHQVVSNPSKGACSARNHALAISKNDWIQWLDADDILEQDKITKHRDQLSRNPATLIVSPFIPFIDNPTSGAIKEERQWDFPYESTPADWMASEAMTIPACWMGHRSTFEKAGPWDTTLQINQDGEYFARAVAVAERVLFEPTTNVWYRRGNSRSVSQFTAEKAASLFASVHSIHKTALAIEDSARMRQMLANRHQHAIYTAYPHCPDGIERARKALRELPKPTIGNPNAVSSLSKLISSTLGWKTLTKLRMARKRHFS